MNGNITTLINWFRDPSTCNGPADDAAREMVLSLLMKPVAYAVKGNLVIVVVDGGRCLCEAKQVSGCDIVEFDYVSDTTYQRINFWMNASSVTDLGLCLRAHSEKRRSSFDELFVGGKP